ncbi:hypothetical protein KC319_g14989, partial [Hortaea werneckii]
GWGGAGGNNGNQSAAIGAYFYLGCLLEIICGIGEWINGETFNATVFLVLGGYFGASAAVMVPFYNAVGGYGTDVDAAEAAYYASYATFLIFMAVVLPFFTIASVRLDICHVVLFACFTVCFPCEAMTYFYMADGNDSAAHTFRICSGVSSLAGSAIVWYLLLGSLLEAVDFPYLLPVGDLKRYVKGRSEKLDRRRHKTSMSCKLYRSVSMMWATVFILGAFFSATWAQLLDRPEYGLRLSFYDPSRSHACGQGSVSGNESNAISFHTWDVPSYHLCLNLNETFTQPNKSYTEGLGGYSCLGDTLCGINYTISGVENFNNSANYSSIYYQYFVGGNVEEAIGTVGYLEVQTYGGENCMQGGPDDGISLYPWVRWSCQSEGGCTTLPYNIKSIALTPTEDYYDDDSDKCYIASALGGSGVYDYLSQAQIGGGMAIKSATWIVDQGVPKKQSCECAAIVAKLYDDVDLADAGSCNREE